MVQIRMMNVMIFVMVAFIVTATEGCSPSGTSENVEQDTLISKSKTANKQEPVKKLLGTWVSNSANHFKIIEIADSANATIYRFEKWTPLFDNTKQRRAFYKADGKIDSWNEYSMAIQAGKFHFYYMVKHDTLLEMAEPGPVDTLVRVYNDSTIEK